MFKKVFLFLVFTSCVLRPLLVSATPYLGIDWGTPKGEVVGEIIRDDKITVISDLYVRKPMPIFESYIGHTTNDDGLFAVIAWSKYISDDHDGKKGKAKFFETIREMEKLGFKKKQSLIKNSGATEFYSCLNKSYEKPCSFYIWIGYDKNRDTISVSLESFLDNRGYVSTQFIRKGYYINGKH